MNDALPLTNAGVKLLMTMAVCLGRTFAGPRVVALRLNASKPYSLDSSHLLHRNDLDSRDLCVASFGAVQDFESDGLVADVSNLEVHRSRTAQMHGPKGNRCRI